MPTARPIEAILQDIVEWSGRIEYYIGTMTFEAFLQDQRTQDAVIRCLEVIGEAAAQILKVAPDFQQVYPDLELRQAYRARNRTAHGYGTVSLDTVWRSAVDAAPRMGVVARRILDERRS